MPAVKVRVPLDHTSDASVPKDVRVRAPEFQTAVGTARMYAPSEDEAVCICALVLALTTAASEVEAVPTVVETPAVAVLVLAFMRATTELEAFVIWLFVLALIALSDAVMAEAMEVVAVVMSD